MKLEHEELTKELEKLPPTFNNNSLRRKIEPPSPENNSKPPAELEKGKGSWENDKKMLEMEEQLKETKKNQTFPLTPVHVVGKHQGRR